MLINNRLRFINVALLLLFMAAGCQHEVFLECESFENKGGWVVDPQFVEQMGSPYLMAHGMGEPVKNASTTVQFPSSNTYHVWARTTDWAPGNWNAPGRFNIIIEGAKLENTLGNYKGWGWNYAGKVNVKEGSALLELEDLTGFNARCDAIYISNKYQTPTNQGVALSELRDQLTGSSAKPEKTMDFDLVVVGGGIAGCAASIAAAERGLKVALIHDRPVLGGNASSEIRVHTLGIYGHFERILKMLDTEHYPNGSPDAFIDEYKRHKNVEQYSNISLFLEYRAYDAPTRNLTITSVDARHTSTGEQIQFNAPFYIDCTGDGWIGYWAGADYQYGRESVSEYGEEWEEYGEMWSPENADNQILGASVLWRTFESDSTWEFPEVPWAKDVVGNYGARKGTWNWELIHEDWHQIDNAEQIRDHMFKAIYGSFFNEKRRAGSENLKLEWVSYLLGKRESRRLVGDYVYTFNDMRNSQSFPDAVVIEEREVDVHYRQNMLNEELPDFLTDAMFYQVSRYYIPYRSLYSKNIENLFMAGRCFSCSHIGLGGPRVMRTTGQMGAAVGYAASICFEHQCSPRELYEKHLDEYMELVWTAN